MKNKKLVSDLTLDGLFIAILFVMTYVPYAGFVPLGPITITIIHIPVIIGAIFLGWKRGLLYGTAFGLVSLLKAATSPVSLLDPFFVNPLISVLPRLLFGLITGLLAKLVLISQYNVKLKRFFLALVAFAATLIHTTLVFFALTAFHQEYFTWEWAGLFAVNMAFEALAAALLVTLLYFALEKPFKNRLLKYEEDVKEDESDEL